MDSDALLKDDLWRFYVDTYAARVSGGRWKRYDWIVKALREVQKEIMLGGARIIVSAPPRHGKSTGLAGWLCKWYLDWFPDKQIILCAYGEEFAQEWGENVRDEFIYNPLTRTQVKADKRRGANWKTTEGGGMKTAGIGGGITGRGGDLFILTDPHKNWAEVQSPTYRKKTIDWFNSTLDTRTEPGASIVIEHTRWHEQDLAGYCENEHQEEWKVIRFPALAEDDNDPIGRVEGEALCPERFSAEDLEAKKRNMGSFMFSCIYQQRAAPEDGAIIKRPWIRHYNTLPEPMDEWGQFWDLPFSDGELASYLSGQVWGRKGANFYLVDQVRGRMVFLDMLRAVLNLTAKYPQALRKEVEAKAAGQPLLDTLQGSVPGLVGKNPRGSKLARFQSVSGLFEAGNVYLPDPRLMPWVDDYVEEIVTFPNAKNDDQADTTSMALERLAGASFNFDFSLSLTGDRDNPWEFNNARFH